MKTAPASPSGVLAAPLDVQKLRADFPILAREINGYPLAYLDSAASAQTPRQVLDAMNHVYEHHYANVHRGVYTIAAEATDAYEAARDAAMALERKRTYGCIRPVCRCIVGATSLSACGAGCLPSDLGRA